MLIIQAPHKPSADHLAAVKAEMATLGAPKIRCVDLGDGTFRALEGSHRLAAAAEIGLTPEIEEMVSGEEIEHDFQDLPSPCDVQEIVDFLGHRGPQYRFEE